MHVSETAHSVKAGDATTGNPGTMHLKQASQIASNLVPGQHQVLNTQPDVSAASRRGFSVQLAAGSAAASPERRLTHANTE